MTVKIKHLHKILSTPSPTADHASTAKLCRVLAGLTLHTPHGSGEGVTPQQIKKYMENGSVVYDTRNPLVLSISHTDQQSLFRDGNAPSHWVPVPNKPWFIGSITNANNGTKLVMGSHGSLSRLTQVSGPVGQSSWGAMVHITPLIPAPDTQIIVCVYENGSIQLIDMKPLFDKYQARRKGDHVNPCFKQTVRPSHPVRSIGNPNKTQAKVLYAQVEGGNLESGLKIWKVYRDGMISVSKLRLDPNSGGQPKLEEKFLSTQLDTQAKIRQNPQQKIFQTQTILDIYLDPVTKGLCVATDAGGITQVNENDQMWMVKMPNCDRGHFVKGTPFFVGYSGVDNKVIVFDIRSKKVDREFRLSLNASEEGHVDTIFANQFLDTLWVGTEKSDSSGRVTGAVKMFSLRKGPKFLGRAIHKPISFPGPVIKIEDIRPIKTRAGHVARPSFVATYVDTSGCTPQQVGAVKRRATIARASDMPAAGTWTVGLESQGVGRKDVKVVRFYKKQPPTQKTRLVKKPYSK